MDATLYEPVPAPMPEYAANGSGDYTFAGTTRDGLVRRAVIAFAIAGQIPAGATIDSVELTLNVSRVPNPTNLSVTSLHRLLTDWGEGESDAPGEEGEGQYPPAPEDVTWIHRYFDHTFWAAPGGDYVAGNSANIVVGDEDVYTWGSTAGMVADVQQWLDQPASNFGWIIIGDEAENKTTKRFDSRELVGVTQPQLTVSYTPQAVVGSCCTGETCQVVTETACLMLDGEYGGDGTSCSPNPCVDPFGACCADDGTCTEVTLSVCEAGDGEFQGEGSVCQPLLCPVDLTPWLDALPLPAVATPVSGAPGASATYDLAIRQTTQQLHSELSNTTVWGYDDGTGTTYPGPTIEAASDEQVTVNWINDLREGGNGPLRTDHYLDVDTACIHGAADLPAVVTHLHGGHVEARFDGYPEATFLPGQMESYQYPNGQQAGTLWYHDHALGITRLNVYMGLAGLYTLRDAVETGLNIPSGDFEVPLAIQDRRFLPGGELYYPTEWQDHFFGDKALVNGKVWPYLDVTRGKYRFRVLNGSGSRVYTLSLSPPSGTLDFTVIGNEGGLLEAPVPGVSTLTIGPGERYDVVVDFEGFSPGDEIVMENSAPAPFPNGTVDLTQIIKFEVVVGAAHTDPLPATLRPVVPIDPGDAVIERDFVLNKAADDGCGRQNWQINGLGWDDITEYPELGTVEIWRFINDSGAAHPMHMHLVFFQVIERQAFTIGAGDEIIPVGGPVPPPEWERGWKDTAMVYPGEMLRVIARFEDFAGRYAYHCHILEHEDHEMMRQFQTIVPGCTVTGEEGEFCDGVDNDCNGLIDDGCSTFSALKEISVDAGTTWFDANDMGTAPIVDFPSPAEYRITVSNSGPVDMSNVVVNDSTLGVMNYAVGNLGAGTSVELTSAQIAALSVAQRCSSEGTFSNTATADGESADTGTPAAQAGDAANLVCVAPPSIQVVKEISVDGGITWFDANDLGSAPIVEFPSPAEYRITVSNPGATDLVDVFVNDPTLGVMNHEVGNLAAGADVVLTGLQIPELSVPVRCDSAGDFTNIATADGNSAQTGNAATQATDPAVLVCGEPPIIIDGFEDPL